MRRDNVILVGFMGAGKSVCGRLLARRLGRCFVETDEMIVASEGRSMAEVEELYRSRQPYYRRAHITIDTTGLGADQVVARILSALREAHAVRA